jgi:serpin B
MPTAFTDGANFEGISTVDRLRISKIIHESTIDVDEEGTVATAATATVMVGKAAPIAEPLTFRVDEPFAYCIRNPESGAILFVGRVNEPATK